MDPGSRHLRAFGRDDDREFRGVRHALCRFATLPPPCPPPSEGEGEKKQRLAIAVPPPLPPPSEGEGQISAQSLHYPSPHPLPALRGEGVQVGSLADFIASQGDPESFSRVRFQESVMRGRSPK